MDVYKRIYSLAFRKIYSCSFCDINLLKCLDEIKITPSISHLKVSFKKPLLLRSHVVLALLHFR